MVTHGDEDGFFSELTPQEAEDLTLFLLGHSQVKTPALKQLGMALAAYCNPRKSYHERLAGAKAAQRKAGAS